MMENNSSQDNNEPNFTQDTPTPRLQVVNGEAKKSSGKGKKILMSLAGLVLIVGLGSTAYLYADEKSENESLQSQVSELNSEISDTAAAAAITVAQAEEVETKNAEYKAEIGKFTLTLPNSFAIIEKLDQPFEGGPQTIINIGQFESDKVVVSNLTSEIKITAGPSDILVDSKSLLEGNSYLKKTGDVVIDGQSAEIFTGEGLLNERKILFTNSDKNITYLIEIVDTVDKDKDKQTVDTLIKGFKFN